MSVPKPSAEVAAVFQTYPPSARKQLLELRRLVYSVATMTDGTGGITETLKWGEPAYVTNKKSGSTIRLGWQEKNPEDCAMYFICTTTLVSDFRSMFGDTLRFEGNRALLLDCKRQVPTRAVKQCIAAALTYHQNK